MLSKEEKGDFLQSIDINPRSGILLYIKIHFVYDYDWWGLYIFGILEHKQRTTMLFKHYNMCKLLNRNLNL